MQESKRIPWGGLQLQISTFTYLLGQMFKASSDAFGGCGIAFRDTRTRFIHSVSYKTEQFLWWNFNQQNFNQQSMWITKRLTKTAYSTWSHSSDRFKLSEMMINWSLISSELSWTTVLKGVRLQIRAGSLKSWLHHRNSSLSLASVHLNIFIKSSKVGGRNSAMSALFGCMTWGKASCAFETV